MQLLFVFCHLRVILLDMVCRVIVRGNGAILGVGKARERLDRRDATAMDYAHCVKCPLRCT